MSWHPQPKESIKAWQLVTASAQDSWVSRVISLMVLQIAQSISVYGSYFAAVIGVISNDLILGVLSLFQKQPQRQKNAVNERETTFFVLTRKVAH